VKRELREVVELRVEGRRYIPDGEGGGACGRDRGWGEKERVFMGYARLWLCLSALRGSVG